MYSTSVPVVLASTSLRTVGWTTHEWVGEAVLRAAGVPVAKSAALSFVSTQPPSLRKSARVALIVGAGPEPSKKLAPFTPVPYPTKSMICASCPALHGAEPPLQPNDTAELTRATLPAPAAMLIGVASVISAVGRADPTAPLLASWT